jgi:hypothetical protein
MRGPSRSTSRRSKRRTNGSLKEFRAEPRKNKSNKYRAEPRGAEPRVTSSGRVQGALALKTSSTVCAADFVRRRHREGVQQYGDAFDVFGPTRSSRLLEGRSPVQAAGILIRLPCNSRQSLR